MARTALVHHHLAINGAGHTFCHYHCFIFNLFGFYIAWMQIKLGFVALLFAYHFKNHQMFKQLQRGEVNYTSKFMRIWNEGATLILFAVIFSGHYQKCHPLDLRPHGPDLPCRPADAGHKAL